MDIDKLLEGINDSLTLNGDIDINQDIVDEIIDYCIKNDLREKGFRVALTFGDYNYYRLAKYYISVRDSWYLSELLYVVGEDNIEIYKVYTEVINTNDKNFIDEVENYFMSYFVINDKEELLNIINSYR